MATLQLKQLKKSYDQVEVLHRIDLTINEGEFIVVVGPSGCGKSTFLRLLAGLEMVTEGELWLGDKNITHTPAKSRDMAMVFQNYALYPHMSVFDNMAYGLKIRGFSKSDIKARVEEAAEMLDLLHLLKRKPRQLSGGQRQRVAMGRALVRHPSVFLFDEPLSNLDAKLRVDTRVKIHKLQRRLGITSVYVTHDQTEAMTLADRLIVLNKGYVEQIGTPLELYHHPRTKFVASFIGSPAMNFIELSADEQREQLGQEVSADSVCVGIRPEHFQLLPEARAGFCLKARVDMIEALGHEYIVFSKVLGSDQEFSVRLNEKPVVGEGDEVFLYAPADKLHFFDVTSGVAKAR